MLRDRRFGKIASEQKTDLGVLRELNIREAIRSGQLSSEDVAIAQGVRPVGPNEVGWMESALTTLADSGLTGAESLDILALLAAHVRGLAVQAVASGDDNTEGALGRQVSQALAAQADRYPHTAAAFTESGPPGDRNNALNFGIDRILDGLGVLIAARTR